MATTISGEHNTYTRDSGASGSNTSAGDGASSDASSGSLQSEFALLAAGVIGADPTRLDDEGLRLAVGLCCQLSGMVSVAEARFIAELERRGGEHEARETLRRRGKRSKRQADRRTKTAKTTAANPALQDALSSGEISDEHADVIADAEESHPGAADELLPKAKVEGVDRFRNSARDWSRDKDGDDGASQAEAQHKARRGKVFVRPDDGMGVSIFELDPTDHASVSHALAYWIRREQQAEQNCDDGVLSSRSSRQRVADAFVAMAAASLTGGSPGLATARMLVITRYDPLTRTLTGCLPDGTKLSADTVRRLGCDAGILPAVFGSRSQPLNLGRESRTVTPGLRALLTERDHRCRGCGAPAEFCQAHHIQHWSRGGPTDLENLVLLCSRCHHLVHEAGHQVHRRPDGSLTLTGPTRARTRNGTTSKPPPRPPRHAQSGNRTPRPGPFDDPPVEDRPFSASGRERESAGRHSTAPRAATMPKQPVRTHCDDGESHTVEPCEGPISSSEVTHDRAQTNITSPDGAQSGDGDRSAVHPGSAPESETRCGGGNRARIAETNLAEARANITVAANNPDLPTLDYII